MAKTQVSHAKSWAENSVRLQGLIADQSSVALRDCAKLYGESESRLSFMIADKSAYTHHDMLTWVSAVMTNHRTCLDGLLESWYLGAPSMGKNLTMLLREALVLYAKNTGKGKGKLQKILKYSHCIIIVC